MFFLSTKKICFRLFEAEKHSFYNFFLNKTESGFLRWKEAKVVLFFHGGLTLNQNGGDANGFFRQGAGVDASAAADAHFGVQNGFFIAVHIHNGNGVSGTCVGAQTAADAFLRRKLGQADTAALLFL